MSEAMQLDHARMHRADRLEIAAAYIVAGLITADTKIARVVDLHASMVERLREQQRSKSQKIKGSNGSHTEEDEENRQKTNRARPADLRQIVVSILLGGMVLPGSDIEYVASVYAEIDTEMHAFKLRRSAERKGEDGTKIPPRLGFEGSNVPN